MTTNPPTHRCWLRHHRPHPASSKTNWPVENLDPIVQPLQSGRQTGHVGGIHTEPRVRVFFQLMCSTGRQRHTIRGDISDMMREKTDSI